jgi:hypothetical protein
MTRPEDVVRQALQAEASRVEVSPGALETIRGRIGRRQRRLTLSLAGFATALTATAAAVVLGLGSCVPPAPPSRPPIGAPTTTQSLEPIAADRVPVYFVGPQERLYREYHVVSATDLAALMRQALTVMLAGQNRDPDYHSAWAPGVQLANVRIDGTVADVELTNAAAPDRTLADQELVWTVTGVAADMGVQLTGVRINGGAPLTRGPATTLLAPVWLIQPEEGDEVGTSFDVHVSGRTGLSVMLAVRDPAGAVVQTHPVPLTSGAFAFSDGFLRLTLDPGRYTLEVYYLTGATPQPAVDNHIIIVH